MPIRPENRDRYPQDWQAIRERTLQRSRWRRRCTDPRCYHGQVPVCEGEALAPCPTCSATGVARCECAGECGIDHLQWPPGGMYGEPHANRCLALDGVPHPDTGSVVVLTIAHLDHQPENCRPDNLRAMCQRCHLAYDADHHREQRYRNARADLEKAGQRTLDFP